MAWLTGYNYRKSVTLSRASGAVSNYQMKLLVGESSGATGEDVDCGGLCLSTFNDIRFTTSDGTTLLDYWIESISGTTPNQLATVWIEFDSIGTSSTTFYMYYGNAEAAAASNGANTFIVFDDFERGSNGDTIGGIWTEVAPYVHISTEQKFSGSRSALFPQVQQAARPTATTPLTASNDNAFYYRLYMSGSPNYAGVITHGNGTNRFLVGVDSNGSINYYNGSSWAATGSSVTKDTWELLEVMNIDFSAKTMDIYKNGSLIKSAASFGASADQANVVRIYGDNVGSGGSVWIDNFIIRNWRTTEPAWGSWVAEEIEQIEESLSISATMTPEQMVETIAESASISTAMTPELMVETSHDFVVVGAVMEGDTRSDSIAESAGISDLFSGYNVTGDPPEELFREISELFGIAASFSAANYYSKSITESLGLADASTPSLGLSITETLFIYDAIINGWGLTVDESLVLADTISDVLGLMISDWLTLVDSQTNNWNGRDIINDTLNLYDISEKYFMVSTSVNESLVVADTANYVLTVTVLEYLGFTELASAMKSMSQSLNDSLAFSDSPDHAIQLFITEALAVVDVSSVIVAFFKTVQESLTMADTVSFINRLGLSLNEYLVLTETVTSKGTLYNAVYDTLKMSVTVELGGEVYECYVLNTPKFMPSMYSGFNFNSYCVFENRAFGANDTGIYELTGATDAGATIHTGAILSQTDFGARNEKRFRRAYLGISGSAPVMIFETEEGARQVYNINSEGKTVISHELKSRKWKLSIADFDELDTLKLIPVILSK
jgi:hypothetical protein